jgi:hypothetical protein
MVFNLAMYFTLLFLPTSNNWRTVMGGFLMRHRRVLRKRWQGRRARYSQHLWNTAIKDAKAGAHDVATAHRDVLDRRQRCLRQRRRCAGASLAGLSRVDASTLAKLFWPYHSPPTRRRSSNQLLMSPSPLRGRCGRIRRMLTWTIGWRDFRQPEPPDVPASSESGKDG